MLVSILLYDLHETWRIIKYMANKKSKKKQVVASVKLQLKPGVANPSPPVGPALGQHGVNIMEFCKSFNTKTQNLDKELPVPVIISIYKDRSFTFIVKTPPVAALILKKLGLKSGSAKPNSDIVGEITVAQLIEIAHVKMIDLTAASLKAAVHCIAGTARSLGVKIIDFDNIENIQE